MTWVLSTRWSLPRARDGEGAIELLLDRGAEGIEIAPGLAPEPLRGALAAVRKARAPVISVCAPTPRPRLGKDERSPEALDPDPGIRAAFGDHVRSTIEVAHEMEARFVVLSLTSPLRRERDDALREALPEARADGGKDDSLLRAAAQWRSRRSVPDLDAAKRIIEASVGTAETHGVALAFPLRSSLYGFPDAQEAAEILREFRGAPIGIWFDIASAGLVERLGQSDRGIIDACGERIEGVRIHDLRGWTRHRPPGEGELDREWEAVVLRRFRGHPLILDVSAQWDGEAIDRARDRIESIARNRPPASERSGFPFPPGVDSGPP